MMRRMLNEARFDLTLDPVDPLLIRSGVPSVGGADMSFVRSHGRTSPQGEPWPVIPGSSLKGAFRAHAERICRTLRPGSVCLPYLQPGREPPNSKGQASCGFRLDEVFKKLDKAKGADPEATLDSAAAYRHSCAACRMFGSVRFRGRVETSDAYLIKAPTLEVRDGVAIDRHTGGVAGPAKFDLEVLTTGTFQTSVRLLNFERWQLGLLGLVIRDLLDGTLRLGAGKARGLGRMRGVIDHATVSYMGASAPAGFVGLSVLATAEERDLYGFWSELGGSSSLGSAPRVGVRHTYELASDLESWLQPAVDDLVRGLESSDWPKGINGLASGAH